MFNLTDIGGFILHHPVTSLSLVLGASLFYRIFLALYNSPENRGKNIEHKGRQKDISWTHASLKLLGDRGKRGEQRVANRLRNGLPESYLILNDIYLPLPDGTTTQIDHIVVSEFGIFVVETKNYSGWIFADANAQKWTQTIYHKKNSFQNPIRQNYRHICAIANTLSIPQELLTGVVAFTGDCDFKTAMPSGVVYSRKVADYILSFTQPKIKADQIPEIAEVITEWQATVTDDRRTNHVANLKTHHETANLNGAPICSYCGAEMIIRTRRSDGKKFYGCPNYPKCKNIINIREQAATGDPK